MWQVPGQSAPASVGPGRPLTALATLAWLAFAALAVLAGAFGSLVLAFVMMDTGGSPGLGPWYPVLHIGLPVLFAIGIHRRNLAIALAAAIYGAILGIVGGPVLGVAAIVPGLLSALATYETVRRDGVPPGPARWRRFADRLDGRLPALGRPLRWLTMIVVAVVLSYGAIGFVKEASVTPLARQKAEAAAALAKLYARPEAALYFPGSLKIDGTLGTDAPVNEVIAFYQRELAARGLTPGGGMAVTGSRGDLQVCAWHTHEFVFRLAFWKLDDWRGHHPDATPLATMYDITLRDVQNSANIGDCLHPIE